MVTSLRLWTKPRDAPLSRVGERKAHAPAVFRSLETEASFCVICSTYLYVWDYRRRRRRNVRSAGEYSREP